MSEPSPSPQTADDLRSPPDEALEPLPPDDPHQHFNQGLNQHGEHLSTAPGSSLWHDAWLRLSRNKAAVISLVALVIVALACLVLPMIPGLIAEPNDQNLYARNLPFGSTAALGDNPEHFFVLGSDHLGRDVLARTLFGGRISLTVGILTALVSVTIGTLWGSIAGYCGGWIDSLMMRTVDVLYALPFLVIVILLSANLETPTSGLTSWAVETFGHLYKNADSARANLEPITTLLPLFIAIGVLAWLNVSRIIRASVQGAAQMEYVEAARSLGLGHGRILWRHILPNVLGPVIVYATLTIPSIMLFEASLSFLGVGVKPPNASWGSLIQEGADRMLSAPHLLVVPSLCFIVTLLSLNFIGDGLRDALDVRSSKD